MVISQFHQDMIDKTKELHTKAEKLPIINKIFSANVSINEYKAYLNSMKNVHSNIESSSKEFKSSWDKYGLNIDEYFRLDLIEKDLKILKNNDDIKTQNSNCEENIFKTFHESIGFMYVMTGSMMGGKILAKKIEEAFDNNFTEIPNNYFLAFKDENPKKWMDFLKFISKIENSSTQEEKNLITNGAINAFKYVTLNLKDC